MDIVRNSPFPLLQESNGTDVATKGRTQMNPDLPLLMEDCKKVFIALLDFSQSYGFFCSTLEENSIEMGENSKR